jgi:hypothetical protein
MRHVLIGNHRGKSVTLCEFPPRRIRQRSEGNDRLQRAGSQQCRKPAVSIAGNCRIIDMRRGTTLGVATGEGKRSIPSGEVEHSFATKVCVEVIKKQRCWRSVHTVMDLVGPDLDVWPLRQHR